MSTVCLSSIYEYEYANESVRFTLQFSLKILGVIVANLASALLLDRTLQWLCGTGSLRSL